MKTWKHALSLGAAALVLGGLFAGQAAQAAVPDLTDFEIDIDINTDHRTPSFYGLIGGQMAYLKLHRATLTIKKQNPDGTFIGTLTYHSANLNTIKAVSGGMSQTFDQFMANSSGIFFNRDDAQEKYQGNLRMQDGGTVFVAGQYSFVPLRIGGGGIGRVEYYGPTPFSGGGAKPGAVAK